MTAAGRSAAGGASPEYPLPGSITEEPERFTAMQSAGVDVSSTGSSLVDARAAGLVPAAAGSAVQLSDAALHIIVPSATKPAPPQHDQGLRIMFKDLTYSVASNVTKGESVQLLKGVSAFFEPNQMAALMGPSGSGKTTLLDLLAGRKTVGKTQGTLLFGHKAPTPAFLRRYTGYVEQFDTLLGDLSVADMLLYTAELKRPRGDTLASKRAAVDVLLGKLALQGCRDVKIGDPLSKGISGGQSKRVNIGIALITNPRVLFLDEPTSGLDSFTANGVMRVVKALAADGTTVCATIHSPTAATFALFDRVLMLVRGHVAYFGPQGEAAMRYAATAWPSLATGEGLPALPSAVGNEAEWLTEVITEADQRGEAQALADAYSGSDLKRDNDAMLDQYIANAAARSITHNKSSHGKMRHMLSRSKTAGSSMAQDVTETPAADIESGTAAVSGVSDLVVVDDVDDNAVADAKAASALTAQLAKELDVRSSTVTPWWWGWWILLKYRSSHNFRNPGWLGPRIADKLLISLIILTLYLGIGNDINQDQLINIQSALFMWALLPAFGAASYVPAIVLERRLFIRERADGLYAVVTYLAAKLTEEIALSTVITLIFAVYVWFGVQFVGSFAVFWLVYFLDLCVGIVLAYLIAALSPNMDVANAALPGYVVTLLFFAGQLITFDAMPNYWKWYSYIDFLRFGWGALMLNQFEDNDIEFTNGLTILEYYGLKGHDKWAYVGYLAIFWAVFATLAWVVLSYVRHQKR